MADQVLGIKPKEEAPATGIEGRAVVAEGLSGVFADTYVLLLKTQAYHWNVVGPLFYSLHKLTEAQYQDLFTAGDELAERIRALGYLAPSSLHALLEQSRLQENAGAPDAETMIENLIRDHESTVRRLREVTELADQHHDQVTADMLTGRMTVHEKAIWMLRAITAS